MAKYVGLWHGGSGYSQGEWATDAEVFNSIEHAKRVLEYRHANVSHLAPATHAAEWHPDGWAYAGHALSSLATPAVGDDCELYLIALGDAELGELEEWIGNCSHRLTIGPRGGVRVERI